MEIRNLEELLKTISPNIVVFDENGELTQDAYLAYDKLVSILEFLDDQGVIENKSIIDKLDSWVDEVVEMQY
jgi:hypothetical protein